jgi:hypothetical protein
MPPAPDTTLRPMLAVASGVGLALVAFAGVAVARSHALLPRGPSVVDGVRTLDDAVAACRASPATGWDLAEEARLLVHRKMCYSRRNHFDSAAAAFARGEGYCLQQAQALQLLYDRLGIPARLVHALRVWFPAAVIHGVAEPAGISGHAWLQVRVGDEERDVCPFDGASRPGQVTFRVLSPVHDLPGWLAPLMHVACAGENIRRDWPNLWRTGT